MLSNEYRSLRVGMIWLAVTLTVTRVLQIKGLIIDKRQAEFIGRFVNLYFLLGGYLLLLLPALFKREWLKVRLFAAAGIAGTIAVQFLKFTVGLWLHRPSHSDGGFPSGHAEASFLLAYLISGRYPLLTVPAYAVASVITWSRVPYMHFFYQIVGGGILGLLVVTVVEKKIMESDPGCSKSPGCDRGNFNG